MPDVPDTLAARFTPDYTPEQMENLGVYDALYRGQAPRIASLGEWKPEWVSEHDPKGWAQWYKRYSAGRRLEGEDDRQIKRWLSFKARHGGPFGKNPTPRRGWALRNWGIDPAKLVAAEQSGSVTEMLDEYQRKAMQRYVQERAKQAATTYYHGSPDANIEKLRPDSYVTPDKRIAEIMGRFHEDTGKPWSDDDLDQPYNFGPEIHFKPDREPTGKPTVYAVVTDPANLDLLDNPYEHKTKLELAVQKAAAQIQTQIQKSADLNPDIQLQEHQQRIADRLTGEDPRLLVYHGLGSGKSLSALAAAEAAKKQFGDNYGIAVPASLRGNFQKEINKFTHGSDPEIMSYTGLALGKKFQEPPKTLIMDEAHRLRNPGAASALGAREAAQAAKRLVLLTGSPITNSPSDLANLLGMLHNKEITPEEFEKRYIDYKKVSPGFMGWLRGVQPGEQPVIKNESELRGLLKGKVDYQPSKTPEGVNVNEEIVRVPLSPQQQKIQKAIRTKVPPGFLWKLDQEFPLSRDELAKLNSFLTGMRQVSLSTQPFRADKDPRKAFEQSAKLQEAFKRLKATLDSDKRKKAIIYSNFIDSGLAPYAAGLEQAGVPHAFFHGGISPKARQAAVEAYNKGKLRALLIGPAGAEGLSTKGTSLIQLMDPHWHESRSQQARGRGLRFDSHRDLPEELKNVAVQRFISSSEDPSWLGKLMGYSRERTGDEVLEHLTADKEKLNDVFRKVLREAGTEKQSASPLARFGNALLGASPALGGGSAGWFANDQFLNQFNPDVSDLGRFRSNLRGATMGAAAGLMGAGRTTGKVMGLGGLGAGIGLGARYGVVTPEAALGKYSDPGSMRLPKLLAYMNTPEGFARSQEWIQNPVKLMTEIGVDKGYQKFKEDFVEGKKLPNGQTQTPKMQKEIGKKLREDALPATYAAILETLGSPVKMKTVRDGVKGVDVQVPDVSFADIGSALAPHVVGGLGGGYLGYRTGDAVGNFLFPDNPKEEYDRRRSQEDRRWWLQFLGGNLGAVGGTIASVRAMPHLKEIVRNLATAKATEKKAASPWARAAKGVGSFLKNRGTDLAYGAGITAGQYGLNQVQPGYIPGASFDSEGNITSTVASPAFLAGLTAVNAVASRPWRRAMSKKLPGFPLNGKLPKGSWFPLWSSGTALAAGPALVNPAVNINRAADLLWTGREGTWREALLNKLQNKQVTSKPLDSRNAWEVAGQLFTDPGAVVSTVTDTAAKELNKRPWQDDVVTALKGVAQEAKVPGFSEENSIKKMLGSAGLATLGQGAGLIGGGVAGLVGGDWLTDKILNAAVDRKWIKKRKNLHKFIRDLGSLAGAGVGAYGALRAMDYGVPAAQAYYAKRQQQQNAAANPPASV